MSKCSKVTNPCKICLGSVNQRTGLQCHGACESWVHYACLHYTPGRISDIKAGIIQITCPCPDCKSTLPKELRTDEPFTCTNTKCPANQPPKCENTACPSNHNVSPPEEQNQSAHKRALSKCGTDCKEHTVTPNQLNMPPASPADNFFNDCRPTHTYSPAHDVPGDIRKTIAQFPSMNTMEQMCNTVGQLTTQINDLMNRMKQAVQHNGYEDRGGQAGCIPNPENCNQTGPKSLCPKPCYCPGNPARRK